MAPRPPSGCRVRALPAPPLLLSLLLLLLLQPATPGVTCPPPMSVEHADIRVKNYSLKSRERYTCNSGFKRKAGTSSLTECVFNETMNIAHWTVPNLKCIRDPSLTHLRPSSTEVPAGVTPEPESTSLSGKGTYSYHSGAMTAVIGIIAVAVLCVVLVVILVCYGKSRHTAQTPSVEMESMEEMPMTRGTNGREEDAENYPHDPGHSRERLRAAEAGAKAPTLP
ncbi:interleukin-15 receptor subunit alpha isoform X2 [Meles meles]|uniref:interleukin-15 receptor subunit alpha isoform X2 n=1 Tax=Meles meles TaxID=9662 RepID=UPI001E69FB68|nr:interleukin-15 receptor subunit alpha isoform X2 [Meles meles]